jgi:hypothetical protein
MQDHKVNWDSKSPSSSMPLSLLCSPRTPTLFYFKRRLKQILLYQQRENIHKTTGKHSKEVMGNSIY